MTPAQTNFNIYNIKLILVLYYLEKIFMMEENLLCFKEEVRRWNNREKWILYVLDNNIYLKHKWKEQQCS